MCQQLLQFCNNSARLLLFVGAALTLLLALTIGYHGCTSQALYELIDPGEAQKLSVGYYLQLAATAYLALVALITCYAAQYDQKYSIRALAVLSSVTCLVALAAVLMLVTDQQQVSARFKDKLERAAKDYDFTEKFPEHQNKTLPDSVASTTPAPVQSTSPANQTVQAKSSSEPTTSKPLVSASEAQTLAHNSTCLWDKLQAYGCCGVESWTTTWANGGPKIPKSCCTRDQVETKGDDLMCKEVDAGHKQGCLKLIESTSSTLSIVLVLVAVVSLYLAVISGIGAYKTIHYSEASQSAYS